MSEKRMKKNISFSPHEEDIYEYLNEQRNASALIKRLIYNHMIMERGIAMPNVVVKQVPQETPELAMTTETQSKPKVEPKVEPKKMTIEEVENQALAQALEL